MGRRAGERGAGVLIPTADKSKKYEEVEMPAASDMLPKSFTKLAEQILELNEEIKEREERLSLLKAEAKAMVEEVADAASWSARGEGWVVSYVKPLPRKTLVPELLIQQGVTVKQIEKATKETPSTPYVTIRASKEKE